MELENNNVLQNDKIVEILQNCMQKCAQEWKSLLQIDRVITKDCYVLLDCFQDLTE